MTEEVVKAPSLSALKTFIDNKQLKVEIGIDMTNLDQAMITHAGLELHYATQTANARHQYERVKSAVEILEAKLDAEMRDTLAATAEAEKKKAPTEAAIKAAVLVDKRYSGAKSRLNEAQYIWKLCEAAENAFHSRKDMLLEIARDRRKEREGQLRVMEENKESLLKRFSQNVAS